MHAAAQQGIAGSSVPLPHLDRIQASFGKHDLSAIAAHVDASAARASESIGASAYAVGNHVAFGDKQDLHAL